LNTVTNGKAGPYKDFCDNLKSDEKDPVLKEEKELELESNVIMNIFDVIKSIRVTMITRIERLEEQVLAKQEEHDERFESFDEAKTDLKTEVILHRNAIQNSFDEIVANLKSDHLEMHEKYEEKIEENFEMYMVNLRTSSINRTNYKLELDTIINNNTSNI